jgi:hypothetical protein
MNTVPLATHDDQDETERPEAWDAYRVWNEQVRQSRDRVPLAVPAQGWDPYFVWLSRVRKFDQ